MKLSIAVLPGDGIGPEVVAQAVKAVNAVAEKFSHEVSFTHALVGACAIDKYGDPYPDETHEICMGSDAVLFGAVGDPRYDNDPTSKVRPEQGLLAIRKKLGLYANLRPVETFPQLLDKSPLKKEIVEGADFLCVRRAGDAYVVIHVESDFLGNLRHAQKSLLLDSLGDVHHEGVAFEVRCRGLRSASEMLSRQCEYHHVGVFKSRFVVCVEMVVSVKSNPREIVRVLHGAFHALEMSFVYIKYINSIPFVCHNG